jgi:hypothetical protein
VILKKMSGTKCPTTQRHIPEDWNLQQQPWTELIQPRKIYITNMHCFLWMHTSYHNEYAYLLQMECS